MSEKAMYWCNPEANAKCSKTGCALNGGVCCTTSHEECALEHGGVPELVSPKDALELKALRTLIKLEKHIRIRRL